jgi:hypothetical protein
MEDLKVKAKKLGLWNMFLPKNHFKEGAGYSNLEYGLMAELLGKSGTASEVFSSLLPSCLFCERQSLIDYQIGNQLRSTRYWQHGGFRQVRHCRTEEEVAGAIVGWQDPICFPHD